MFGLCSGLTTVSSPCRRIFINGNADTTRATPQLTARCKIYNGKGKGKFKLRTTILSARSPLRQLSVQNKRRCHYLPGIRQRILFISLSRKCRRDNDPAAIGKHLDHLRTHQVEASAADHHRIVFDVSDRHDRRLAARKTRTRQSLLHQRRHKSRHRIVNRRRRLSRR